MCAKYRHSGGWNDPLYSAPQNISSKASWALFSETAKQEFNPNMYELCGPVSVPLTCISYVVITDHQTSAMSHFVWLNINAVWH